MLNVLDDSGCLVRALIVAKEYYRLQEIQKRGCMGDVSLFSMRISGMIDYLSADEEKMDAVTVATDENDWKEQEAAGKTVTHIEIHPSLQVGFCTGW